MARRPPQQQCSDETLASQLRLDELTLFNLVAKYGSFSTAAKQLGISQPTASRRIRRLEESLNLRLFERTTHTVTLTELGAQFLSHSQRLSTDFENTLSFVRQTQEEPAGALSVGMPQWVLQVLGTEFFNHFLSVYPRIQLDFHNLSPGRLLIDGIESAEMDLMIHAFLPADRKVIARPVKQFNIDFYASKEYLAASAPISHPMQLPQHRCLFVRNQFWQRGEWQWSDEGQPRSMIINPIASFETFSPALDWARQGAGVVWCPEELVDRKDSDGRLVRLFDGRHATRMTLNGIYPSRRLLSPKVSAFLDALTDFFH
ncbi:DNA-binding transcriptional regulator, LysR family [Ferrimonas sediminum]|uniref:DNA-binding transcriptional regulator, LysR family n=1 Tax=Ferrimonas sediminum TaxID=718193 RepID=A0A1G8VXT0_9GAMM|nr:LysR family transcriptional regulator [Ferrimonas sediminum]SDJ70746.1 DNA-binding transcriptional regulator, LysR family [Ferrimonas sediminum]